MFSNLPHGIQGVESAKYLARNICVVPSAEGLFYVYESYPRKLIKTIGADELASFLRELWARDVDYHKELEEEEQSPSSDLVDDLDDILLDLDFDV